IESYALMAVPLASLINYLSDSSSKIRIPMVVVGLFFMGLNIFQIFQYDRRSLHPDAMTGQLYFQQFGKLEPIRDYEKLLEPAIYPTNSKNVAKKPGRFETITLQNSEGIYFTCMDIDPWLVTVSAAKEDSTTLLKLVTLDNGKIAIKSYQEKLFSAELDKGDFLTATRTSIGGWETFSMEILDSKTIAIKGSNGKYLSIDPATGKIYANKESITNNERFTITYK
ncbi:MAG: fascin domain-containing protein, partial [Bacteroidia bacterium]